MKKGRNPTHPCGIHQIDAATAAKINRQYLSITEGTLKEVHEGDKICTGCLRKTLNEKVEYDMNENDVIEPMSIDETEWFDYDDEDHEEVVNGNDFEQVNDKIEDLPSSQEDKHKKEQVRRTLNIIFKLFNIPAIRDIRRIKNIRQKVDNVCSALYKFCDILLKPEQESMNHYLSMKDSNILLSGLKTLFQESTDNEQIRLLTISPDSWGRKTIRKWFNCTDYQAQQALLLKKTKGLLAFPEYFSGNKHLTENTINVVNEFYLQDGISRASSRKRDIIHINKTPVPIRFMEMTIREAFATFIIQNPTVNISKSSFYALRPREVKCMGPSDTCLCIYHENMSLLFKGLNKYLKSNSIEHNDSIEVITDKYFVNRILCSIPTENCFTRQCNVCGMINPSDILKENNINLNENASWSQWKTINHKVELFHMDGSFDLLLDAIDSHWTNFLLHSYLTAEQREYIKNLRLNSSDSTYIVAQIDFAENFTIFHQREVQGYHWNNKQITIFTVHLKAGSINKNVVIISDYMLHNTAFVYVAQGLIVDFIKTNFPSVEKINYLSDGATNHFKNSFNIFNLTRHKDDFGLAACWTFSSTGHGKGPCDGLGASVKYTATRSIITSGTSISSAEEFYEFTRNLNYNAANTSITNQPPIHVFYIKSTTVEHVYSEILKLRWENLNKTNRIKYIRSFHQFNVRRDGTLVCQRTSNSIDYTTFMFKTNDNSESSIRPVHTLDELDVGKFIIINENDDYLLSKVKLINHLTQEVQVQYYEPPFPATIFYVSRSRNRNINNINIDSIVLLIRHNPI
ncbi:unnamed protein product, partial [Rotaria sp. Silwood1]